VQIGRSGAAWFSGDSPNHVDELAKIKVRYDDPQGDDVFADPVHFGLGFVNQVITVVFYGRDTQLLEPNFDQFVFWNFVPLGEKAGTLSSKNLINSVSGSESGRWTQPKIVSFYLRFTR
jgi:hypothetical protein